MEKILMITALVDLAAAAEVAEAGQDIGQTEAEVEVVDAAETEVAAHAEAAVAADQADVAFLVAEALVEEEVNQEIKPI